MIQPLPVSLAVSANGVYITLNNGKQLIDGMSSWWAAIHGYNNPALNQAIKEQLNSFSHVMFGGLTHKPAIDLIKLLIQILPSQLNKFFLCDSGSVSVEIAMKMAIQYYYNMGQSKKSKFLTIRNGYHGDTFAAMSVCDPITGMHNIFKNILVSQFFAKPPECGFNEKWDEDYILDFKDILLKNKSDIAGVILEPIVQGAGGMRFYSPYYLKRVRELCDQNDILLIFDEIATGFGRTGKMFALEYPQVVPEIMCIGKALTGGYMSLAATITCTKVAEGISKNDGVFMHGPTFMGNPLACSAAIASIKTLINSPWKNRVVNIENQLKQELMPINKMEIVSDVRVLGAIGVVELKKNVNIEKIQKKFIEKGVWIRPFGKLIYLMPPYIIESNELSILTSSIKEIIKSGDI